MKLNLIDTNIWLYRLFDDQRIDARERQRKLKIATSITDQSSLTISTQVINEISANLIKKANFDETQIKAVIQSLYNRCQVVEFSLNILQSASDLRINYNLSFWDSLIVASALAGGADFLYSEDMQDGLIVSGQLNIINPFQ
ncbi:MAG: PIN domain-containing protein [Roseofilum sp. SBFL]|uniref:PIN domain-containing protein n=1 Tax=unclassified Roseofilum TaxID=2620099 RepID=UPI001B0780D1|nr:MULTISPECIES: PIN domain-containing protein [unclassified Roseofilum]MBP0015209.1 PIN domain-containing protein [Roseofilum sp. SID3]MBP0024485.1 PIN domain-containing protein [Roseofilum sp. SID2]MBP0038762.1 PIN domain-containing protein [Roseofilum sp. SID1]MBP0044603.1 PIN domain-containing protein [Roseofilum sp. SBFL]